MLIRLHPGFSRRSRPPRLLVAAAGLLAAVPWPLFAQSAPRPEPPVLRAARAPRPPSIDGRLDDPAWALAPAAGGFVQRNPDEGAPATEATEVRVLYDGEALYVGLRMFDREPGRITTRLSRRDDDPDADRVIVYLDPRLDRLTGASFQLSSAGVQADRALYDDTRSDGSWDAVWAGRVSRDAAGWSAEMRIPYSQLRFPDIGNHTWGINVQRVIRRRNEDAWLVLTPKKERGLVSRMARLSGLDGIQPTRHLELLPYAVARQEMIQPEEAADPFNDGARTFGSAGVDIKWGIASGFTLDATINPDFGQVELDPAVINLTAFETFFEERRPFFTEGAQIFRNFGQLGGGGDAPGLFYSRRIGRAPQGSAAGQFVDRPASSTILGAGKLTGKTHNGWSIGLLEAVTGRERARTWTDGLEARQVIEPLTNHFVGRLLHERGQGGFGLMATGVTRSMDDAGLESRLTRRAFTGGADAYYFFDKEREWLVSGQVSASRVSGTAAAVERLQRSSSRYFQRPDALRLDTARTSLSGWSGNASFGRESGALRFGSSVSAVSPGFEVNDLGYLTIADRVEARAWASWEKFEPDRFTRNREFSVEREWSWNVGGVDQGGSWSADAELTFLNYWDLDFGVRRELGGFDDRLTRGGPMAARPRSWDVSVDGGTDSRKRIYARAEAAHEWYESGSWETQLEFSLNLKVSERLTVSTGPQWERARNVAQHLTSRADALATGTFGRRYLFGDLAQRELSLPTRVNLLLTPNVSLQLYAQPLLGAGHYTAIKEFALPRRFDFLTYGRSAGTMTYDGEEGEYVIDPDGEGPARPFSIEDPDFNEKSLRLQTVFRWEWRPGSTLYLVWTQNREHESRLARFDLARDARDLFRTPGNDVFEIKVSYWIGR